MSDEQLPAGSVIEPDDDGAPWRFVSKSGYPIKYGEQTTALVEHLASHACSVKDAAEAAGMDYGNARAALAKPHVKALLVHLTDVTRLQLQSAAVNVLHQALLSDDYPMAQRVKLALQLTGAGEGARGAAPTDKAQGNQSPTGVSISIGLPHGAKQSDQGVVIDAAKSEG